MVKARRVRQHSDMGVTLRFVADQLVAPTDNDLAHASGDLLQALIASSPRGCDVAAIAPSGDEHLASSFSGLREVQPLGLARRELAASWQLGIAGTVGGGLIHSASLMAPLVRHDRANRGDQTVVTLWDYDAWESKSTISKTQRLWTRAMLKRAAKHADAIVVPTFALAEKLHDLHGFGERIRVIAGAAPSHFVVTSDNAARLRDLNIPASFVVVPVDRVPEQDIADALAGAAGGVTAERDVVVVGAAEGAEPRIAELAAAVGIPERHIHVRGVLDAPDRAAVMAKADVAVFAGSRVAWPWRIIEALRLGIPVVATDSAVHREVIGDGGMLGATADLKDAVAHAVGAEGERLRVLSNDRGRAYSWQSAAEQVWQLHAEL